MDATPVREPAPAGPFVYRFGSAELHERNRELRVGGRPIAVEAKPFDVLLQLLRRPGETLTKDELLELAWPGRVVTEGVLAKSVMKLRALLGDHEQALIRTVHGYGYRLGVAVERLAADEAPVFQPQAGDSVPHRPHWRLLRAIGEGGQALVWLAEHSKTHEQRVFKYARDADGLAALKREVTLYRMLRESLGADAPLVRILDWNVDEPPYHTESELIAGGNLGDWLLAHADAPRALRIELLAQCAEAVAAAHRVGVLHKDLKPANVLVDTRDPRRLRIVLCDFGVGALLEPERLRALGITRHGFTQTRQGEVDTSGTPLYLAPELLGGQAPTVGSDVYALGVMLYQALVGDPRRALAAGWQRDIDDELLREDIEAAADGDPLRRLADAGELATRLRALEERRAERLARQAREQAAARLAAQLERARARRGWLLATLALLLIGATTTSVLYLRARSAAESALAVNQFLNADLLALADPNLSQDPDLKASVLLDRAAARVSERFAGRPALELEVRATLGRGYRGLGALEQAQQQFERAALLARTVLAPDDVRALELALWQADLELARSRARAAHAALVDVRQRAVHALGAESTIALEAAVRAAAARFEAGEEEAAVAELQALLPRLETALGPGDALTIHALNRLAIMLNTIERVADAEQVRRVHLERAEDRYGAEHSSTLTGRLNHAVVLRKLGRTADALHEAEAAEAGLRRVFGFPSIAALHAGNVRGRILLDAGRLEEALTLLQQTLAGRRALLGEQHDDTAFSHVALGMALVRLRRHAEALSELRAALAIREGLHGPQHVDVITNLTLLADTARLAGELDAAERDGREAVRRARAELAPDRPELGNALYRLGQVLLAREQREEARELLGEALAVYARTQGAEHPRSRAVRELLAGLAPQTPPAAR